MDNIWFNKI